MCPFNGLVNKSVLRHDERRRFGEGFPKVLELFDGEAFVVDAGEEVAVLELLSDGVDGFFLLAAGNGGGDGREVVVAMSGFGCGSGFQRGGSG